MKMADFPPYNPHSTVTPMARPYCCADISDGVLLKKEKASNLLNFLPPLQQEFVQRGILDNIIITPQMERERDFKSESRTKRDHMERALVVSLLLYYCI